MPEYPALVFRPPAVRTRETGRGGRARVHGPGPARQEERLAPAFGRLSAAFEAGRLTGAAQPEGLEPEQILVLEIAGEIDDFARAIARVPGLEFLAEYAEEQLDSDEDFATVDQEGRRRAYRRQLFLIASDAQAWQQLLRLWERFKSGEPFAQGFAAFRHLFGLLRDLRPWDDRDRLERAGAAAAWTRDLQGLGQTVVPFEIELWLRSDPDRRAQVVAAISEDVQEAGGRVLQDVLIEDIAYHGLLGTAPASLLLETAALEVVRWLRTEGVRLFHPIGQMVAPPGPDLAEVEETLDDEGGEGAPGAITRVAVLDGMPLENHVALRDRIVVDDPEDYAAQSPANGRRHGTAMSGLAVRGDLSVNGPALRDPVYVRPILRAPPGWVRAAEALPTDRLPVDVIHSAVARLFEGGDAAAPETRVIALAIGDPAQPFDRFLSPLARLLDWLAERYRVLFLVSAGNQVGDVVVPRDTDDADPTELQHEVLTALWHDVTQRRVLAPAEAMNVVTVGAAHADQSAPLGTDTRIDPFVSSDLPNVVSALGGGYSRSTKPDVLMPGGRQRLRVVQGTDESRLIVEPSARAPGVRVAAPPVTAGELDRVAYMCGTSAAVGVAAHIAGQLLEGFDDLAAARGGDAWDRRLDGVVAKAVLVHAARWGDAAAVLTPVLSGVSRRREGIARFLGYGRADAWTPLISDSHRVTLLAAGEIDPGLTHAYSLPRPGDLSGSTTHRRMTFTLAWFSPINPKHRGHRRAALRLFPPLGANELCDRRDEADSNAATRGTVQHEIVSGHRSVVFPDGAVDEVRIDCRADAGALETPVPYALAVTIEVPEATGLDIYTQVQQRVFAPVRVRPGV